MEKCFKWKKARVFHLKNHGKKTDPPYFPRKNHGKNWKSSDFFYENHLYGFPLCFSQCFVAFSFGRRVLSTGSGLGGLETQWRRPRGPTARWFLPGALLNLEKQRLSPSKKQDFRYQKQGFWMVLGALGSGLIAKRLPLNPPKSHHRSPDPWLLHGHARLWYATAGQEARLGMDLESSLEVIRSPRGWSVCTPSSGEKVLAKQGKS